MTVMVIHQTELIVGGQKSGKSKRAEQLVRQWLNASQDHEAVLIATAQVFDTEMQSRIDRHKEIRAETIPEITTIEEPLHIAAKIAEQSSAHNLIVVDCLTVWLTNLLMPHPDLQASREIDPQEQVSDFLQALASSKGPVVLVSNEIGLGVIPMGRETRVFVDELGRLNQRVAQLCKAVTLMVAGIPLEIKSPL